MACVNPKLPQFKQVQKYYKASEGVMINAIDTYMTKNNLDDFDYESQDFEDHLLSFFNQGFTNTYLTKKDTADFRKKWEGQQHLLGKPMSKHDALSNSDNLAATYGKHRVKMYESSTPGQYIVQVAEPIYFKDSRVKIVERVVDKDKESRLKTLAKSAELVKEMIQDAKDNIEFNETDHTYKVDGKLTDTSVTKIEDFKAKRENPNHKSKDFGYWGTPSQTIGNTADKIFREYFDGTLQKSYPNMTSKQLERLVLDAKDLELYFDEKFGKGEYGVVTTEFPISSVLEYVDSKGVKQTMTVAGTMDMMVYDSKGNFYILDMKTVRTKGGLTADKKEGYFRQLNTYRVMLEANYPQLKGKIQSLDIIDLEVFYPAPHAYKSKVIDHVYTKNEDTGQLYIDGKPIQDHEGYLAPHLRFKGDVKKSLINDNKMSDPVGEFKKLTLNEKDLHEEEAGKPLPKESGEFKQTDIQAQRTALNEKFLLAPEERTFLIKNIMKTVSDMITELLGNPALNLEYFKNGKYEDIDFTTKSRQEIIQIIGMSELLAIVKEGVYNPSNREDPLTLANQLKLQHIYDNWSAAVEAGESLLVTLEGVTLQRVADDVARETGDPNAEDAFDSIDLEQTANERWLIGLRQISALGSLSTEIRRAFEKLRVLDSNGPVLDKYGYNMETFVDGTTAVSSILEWMKEATTIEEMESILKEQSVAHPWVNAVVEMIATEPFRSQFYSNFRKDFSIYSSIVAEFKDGAITYSVKLINTNGLEKTVLDELKAVYQEGSMKDIITAREGDLDGKGKVNKTKVDAIIKARQNLYDELAVASKNGDLKSKMVSIAPRIEKMLQAIGLNFDETTFNSFMAADANKRRLNETKLDTLFKEVGYLLDTIKENEKREDYNPMFLEENKADNKGNVYGNYKNIIQLFAKYAQDSIEQSSYENGKMYYSFVTPSYLSNLITQLSNGIGDKAKFDGFIQEEYGKYRWFKEPDGKWNNKWLELLLNPTNASGLQHKIQLNFNKTSYSELGELSYAMSLMKEYFYDGRNSDWAWYRVPTMSNKPSAEFIKFKRFRGNFKKDISGFMTSVMDLEIMRMRTVIERAKNQSVGTDVYSDIKFFDISGALGKDNPAIKNLKSKIAEGKSLTRADLVKNGKLLLAGTGAEFKFLEMFNKNIVTQGDRIGDLIIAKINGEITADENTELLASFKPLFETYMNEIFQQELKQWKNLGLFDKKIEEVTNAGTTTVYQTFKNATILGLPNMKSSKQADILKMEDLMKNALEEYFWNDMFATTNIIQLTVTDLAYSKDVEDFQKRFAQVHSPAMKLNISARDANGVLYSDGISRTAYIADDYIVSEMIPLLKEIFYRKVKEGKMTLQDADIKLASYGHSSPGTNGKFLISKDSQGNDVYIKSNLINVADGQGYSSPTSYRKKLGMAGKWDANMETAYELIRSGKWKGEDLNVVWQPLKPFVYTQMTKRSGSNVMSEMKVPTQMKNSEYLLLMADAIIQGDKLTNKLRAIYEIMEETAYDKQGNYTGKGIDTIQFESAIKSGLMGVININDISDTEEIKAHIRSKLYDDSGDYHDQFIHEFPFEDYGIQQEIPAHLVDDLRMMGSQMRILSISDMSDDAMFKVYGRYKRLTADLIRNQYQLLLGDNIRDSYKDLLKDLKLSPKKDGTAYTEWEKNKALEEILIDLVKLDLKYDSDLLRAVSLNPQGQFTIPLNDPIQSIRVQQLLNSIIKSRINKQKTSGGSMVQVAAYGFSENLSIVWKNNELQTFLTEEEFNEDKLSNEMSYKTYVSEKMLTVSHFEILMPLHSSAMERALTKKDGTLMTPQEAVDAGIISEEQLKVIGYRIPTEDKYSLAPMKIKGFLPRSGEGIVLPKEITTISGSDFDIDKLYAIFKEFKKRDTDWKPIIADLLKDKTLKELMYAENQLVFEETINEAIDNIEQDKTVEEDSGEEYIIEYLKNSKGKYQETGFDEYMGDSREGRNNEVFNMQWAVLTHEDTATKMFNPGSFDSQKKSSRIIQVAKLGIKKYSDYNELSKLSLDELDDILVNTPSRSILYSSTQVYFHKLNMTAAKLIGVFATNNVSHAFISMQDVGFKFKNNEGFMFNGITVNNDMNNRIDKMNTLEGDQLISKVIAGFLAASVDAVKDPVLNFMNINGFTAKAAVTLARLGFDSDSIGLFLTQPSIELLSREFAKQNNDGYVSADAIINEQLDAIIGFDKTGKSYMTNPFTKELLTNLIAKHAQGERGFGQEQGEVLQLFLKIMKMGTDLNDITFLTKYNSVSNAVGPGIADTLVIAQRHNKFMENIGQTDAPFTASAGLIINNSPLLKAFYETTIGDNGAAKALFKDHFHHYSPKFESILSEFRRSVKGNLDAKTINKLVNDYIYYKMTKSEVVGNDIIAGPVFEASFENRNRFINKFVAEFKTATAGIIDNDLIKIILVKPSDKKNPAQTLEAQTGGYSVELQERIKNAWTQLLTSKDPKLVKLGNDLFFYNMLRSGFAFSPKSFMHLASTDVKMSVENYIERIRDVQFGDYNLMEDDFLLQFRLNHYGNRKINPEFQPDSKDSNPYVSINLNGANTLTLNFEKGSSGQSSIVIPTNDMTTVYSPTIIYKDKFYILQDSNDRSAVYKEGKTLGNTNNFLEYDADSTGDMISAVGAPQDMTTAEDINEADKADLAEYEELGLTDKGDLSRAIADLVLDTMLLESLKSDNKTGGKELVKQSLREILEKKLSEEQSDGIIKLIELGIKKLC